jgi:hypothetical protein
MATVITLKFITSVVLYIQLLMLIYLYSAHRVRFFCYLVWAWSLFVISKASYMIQQFFPEATGVLPLFDAAGSAGDPYFGSGPGLPRGVSPPLVSRRARHHLCPCCSLAARSCRGGHRHAHGPAPRRRQCPTGGGSGLLAAVGCEHCATGGQSSWPSH